MIIITLIKYIISSSIIKIPFKINKTQIFSNHELETIVEHMSFIKLYSLVEIGNPPQKIETLFDLKMSNYFISNSGKECLSFYSYKNSKSFNKIKTNERPFLYRSSFYANETFYYNDINNNKKEIKNMLIFLPELNNDFKNKRNNIKNCLNIGLKFPDFKNNNFQESFIQQLKHKNIINQYFWTIIIYKNSNELNNDYDGAFIFGDIFNSYYKNIVDDKDFSINKIVHTYTGSRKVRKSEWGIQFGEIYYKKIIKGINEDDKNINNIVHIYDLVTEFDININSIFGPSSYYNIIKCDFFNFYFNKNICRESYIKNKLYKFIFCHTSNFTKNDLEKFPILNFKNNILEYIFTLDYNDLFLLTTDKKYFIFNIMVINKINLKHNDNNERWVFGLPFLKKYQFSFNIDNKLIYFYNKNKNVSFELKKENNKEIKDENTNEIFNNNTRIDIENSKRIKNENNKKNFNENKKEKIVIFI